MLNRDDLNENQIRIELLDSGSGRAIQSWTFYRSDVVTVGRSPDNTVVVQDPYVSRTHAEIKFSDGRWWLTNLGRHGTLLEGSSLDASSALDGDACLQLGGLGPALRIRLGRPHNDDSDTTMLSAPVGFPTGGLAIDHDRMQREVQMITETPYFRELQQVRRRLRAAQA